MHSPAKRPRLAQSRLHPQADGWLPRVPLNSTQQVAYDATLRGWRNLDRWRAAARQERAEGEWPWTDEQIESMPAERLEGLWDDWSRKWPGADVDYELHAEIPELERDAVYWPSLHEQFDALSANSWSVEDCLLLWQSHCGCSPGCCTSQFKSELDDRAGLSFARARCRWARLRFSSGLPIVHYAQSGDHRRLGAVLPMVKRMQYVYLSPNEGKICILGESVVNRRVKALRRSERAIFTHDFIDARMFAHIEAMSSWHNHGSTAVEEALSQGHAQCVELLLEAGASIHAGILHQTVAKRYPRGARMLLQLGLQLEDRDEEGCTPFHFACCFGCLESLNELVDAGCDIRARAADGRTGLILAVRCRLDQASAYAKEREEMDHSVERRTEVEARYIDPQFRHQPMALLDRLLELHRLDSGSNMAEHLNAVTAKSLTALYFAVQNEDLDAVAALVHAGCDVNKGDTSEGIQGRETPLQLAVLRKWAKGVHFLVNQAKTDLNARDGSGATALHLACETENLVVISMLIQAGCDLTIKDSSGATGLEMIRQMTDSVRAVIEAQIGSASQSIKAHRNKRAERKKKKVKIVTAMEPEPKPEPEPEPEPEVNQADGVAETATPTATATETEIDVPSFDERLSGNMHAVLLELHSQHWSPSRGAAQLARLAERLADSGLDDHSVAQADDDDFNDFQICLEDGLAVRQLLRKRLGYESL